MRRGIPRSPTGFRSWHGAYQSVMVRVPNQGGPACACHGANPRKVAESGYMSPPMTKRHALRRGEEAVPTTTSRDRNALDETLDRDRVEELIRSWCWPTRPDAGTIGRIGVEVEAFPVSRSAAGTAAGRMTLPRVVAAMSPLGTAAPPTRWAVPSVDLPDGGRLTVEPGAQIEHVTPPRADVAAVLHELSHWHHALAAALREAGGLLASAGLDVWHRAEDVRQQLAAPRYVAMARYLRVSGTLGHTMMCHSCSLQVNLDLGPPGVAEERWLVANLVSPLLTATFASSPTRGFTCGRAVAWQGTDRTRTGFPRLLLEREEPDPVATMVDAALTADVLLVRGADGGAVPGRPGWSFADWLAHGDRVHGPPRVSDLAYHLTTLFHEVRLRGFLELRAVDALPNRWRVVPLVLLVGVLYDDTARQAVRALLDRHRGDLPALWGRAAVEGLADPAMCALAVEAWSLAVAGASRLPAGYVPPVALSTTQRFLDRFTLRGRCPADELREELRRSPAAALAWAAEPVHMEAVKGGA
jgi:glutamate--cysteine ligase